MGLTALAHMRILSIYSICMIMSRFHWFNHRESKSYVWVLKSPKKIPLSQDKR